MNTLLLLQGCCELIQQRRLSQAKGPQAEKLLVELVVSFLHLSSSRPCSPGVEVWGSGSKQI